jgi:uncharacterized damage-inducible protein DinB
MCLTRITFGTSAYLLLEKPLFSVWQLQPIENFLAIDQANHEQSGEILKMVDFEQVFHYTTSTGLAFSSTGRDMLFHIINHSTHHRAQIASEFRLSGIPPLVSDYIFFKR